MGQCIYTYTACLKIPDRYEQLVFIMNRKIYFFHKVIGSLQFTSYTLVLPSGISSVVSGVQNDLIQSILKYLFYLI